MARSSLTSSEACASALAGRSAAGGRSKASAESPQSSAFSISVMTACARAEKPMPVIQSGAPRARHRTPSARRGRPTSHFCGLRDHRALHGWLRRWGRQRQPGLRSRRSVPERPSGGGALLFAGEAECASGAGSALGVTAAVLVAPFCCVALRGAGEALGGATSSVAVDASSAPSMPEAGNESAVANAIAPKPAPKDRPPISIPRKPPSVASGCALDHPESMTARCPLRRTPRKILDFLAFPPRRTWT